MRHAAGWLLGGLVAVFVGSVVWCGLHYPAQVPMHWGIRGDVDSWVSPRTAVITMLAVGLGYAAIFALLGFMLGRPGSKLTTLNVPNKKLWLAPEHREEARALARTDVLLTSVPMMPVLIGLPFAMLHASAADDRALPAWLWILLVVCLLLLVGVCVMILLRWQRGPRSVRRSTQGVA